MERPHGACVQSGRETEMAIAEQREFFRETGELTLQIPALARPTLADLQARFAWIRSIERDTSPSAAVTFALGTVLRPDQTDPITRPK